MAKRLTIHVVCDGYRSVLVTNSGRDAVSDDPLSGGRRRECLGSEEALDVLQEAWEWLLAEVETDVPGWRSGRPRELLFDPPD